MTYPKAIVIAAGLLAGAVLLSGTATTHEGGNRFAIASGGTAAGEGAWRVDAYTGRMVWCHTMTPQVAAEGPAVLRGSGGRRVVCYDADGKVDVKLF
ncbi:MAG TPA: hypothetical protein VM325_13655 [Alphaproteobacteria bacterium]|nr:hypothetical protein [Alphaproteobacteria bacterium]